MSERTRDPAMKAADDRDEGQEGGQRLDRWLWFARLVKTRTLAAKFVETGKVRVNTIRVTKPSRTVRPGDVITATLHRRLHVVRVRAPGERRGPAPEARDLYEDLTPPPQGAKAPSAANPVAAREAGAGRPTKRERRRLDRLKTNP